MVEDAMTRTEGAPAPEPGIERRFEIRTYDIDFAGIVSNIVYVRWLEDLRLDLMAAAYPLRRALAEDVAPILLETRIAYGKPLAIDDEPVGRMWVKALERVRWTVAAEFTTAAASHATAEQTGLFIRLSTRRPIAIPAPLRRHFAAGGA
jgi:acyl-CoA thioester hydrolase